MNSHTFDIVIDYRKCPECGFINEDRQKYRYEMGEYLKEITCLRCGNEFTVKKFHRPKFGPLWNYTQSN